MRLINGDRLVEAIRTDYYEHFTGCHSSSEITLLNMILDDIDELPTIEAAPVVHGEWIAERNREGTYAHCSLCGCRVRGFAPNYKFCQNCGAKMKGGAE